MLHRLSRSRITILIILLLLLLAYNIHLALADEVIRHDKELKPSLEGVSTITNLIDQLLKSESLNYHYDIKRTLESIKKSLISGDISLANENFEKLREYISTEDLSNLTSKERGLLSYLASMSVSEGKTGITVILDPQTLNYLNKLLSREPIPLSNIESLSSLMRLANSVNEVNPTLANKLKYLGYLINRGDYAKASELYATLRPQILQSLLEAYRNGLLTDADIEEILRYLPSEISSQGPIKYETDFLESFFESLSGKEFKPKQFSKQTKSFLPISDFLRSLDQISSMVSFPKIVPPSKISFQPTSQNLTWFVILISVMVCSLFLVLERRSLINFLQTSKVKRTLDSSLRSILPIKGGLREIVARYYLYMLEILSAVGFKKQKHETHREFINKVKGTIYEPLASKICTIYEKVMFSGKTISREDVEVCKKSLEELRSRVLSSVKSTAGGD